MGVLKIVLFVLEAALLTDCARGECSFASFQPLTWADWLVPCEPEESLSWLLAFSHREVRDGKRRSKKEKKNL